MQETLCRRHLANDACAYSSPSFSHVEAKALLNSYRGNELNVQGGIISWHDHFGPFLQMEGSGDISGAEEELRSVV